MVSATEVKEFIKKIKDPQVLLNGCREFHKMEPRDAAYVVSRNIISKAPNKSNFVIEGSKMMIVTWNATYIFRRPRKIRDRLGEDILSAYEECKTDLFKFERTELRELDLAGIRNTIKRIFSVFSSKPSIGDTGASKILHVVYPRVFMMWDTKIRNAYHLLHHDKHHAMEDCYLQFMRQSQEIVSNIQTQAGEDDLWHRHLEFLDKDFVQAFSFKETVLKMLDECNYMRFTVGVDF